MEPAGIVLGVATHPTENFHAVQTIAGAVFHGHLGEAGHGVSQLVDKAMHPDGVAGVVYKSGLGLRAAVDGVVGGLELYQGIQNDDQYLKWMGAADLVTCAATSSVALGAPMVGLGLGLAASAAKTYLVLANPEEYSRIQKVKTLFDAAGCVSSGMLKAGILIGPALVMNAVFGPTQMLYMNNEKFRARADQVIDWVIEHNPL